MDAKRPLVEVKDLRVETMPGKTVLDAVSFCIREGEGLGLVGESGSGKTTAALALLGYARPGLKIASGSVRIGDLDVLTLGPRAERRFRGQLVSYVPQEVGGALNPRRRIGALLRETQVAHRLRTRGMVPDLSDLLAAVDLPRDRSFLTRYPFELSGGQQQRLLIAMAFSCEPQLVVLDEPTTGLDVVTQGTVLELIRRLTEQTGKAFAYVTHDLAVAKQLVNEVVVMYAGRVLENGPASDVLTSPKHPYPALLMECVPSLGRATIGLGIPGYAPSAADAPNGCTFYPRCPLGDDHCRDDEPPLMAVDDSRVVRCWHSGKYRRSDAGVNPPRRVGHSREGDHLLEVQDIELRYGSGKVLPTVSGASLTLDPGEWVGLVGTSGSGKTTLARCLAGLHDYSSGTMTLNGAPLPGYVTARTPAQQRAIQLVFQNPGGSLNPSKTVEQLVGRSLRVFEKAPRAAVSARVASLLERVNLAASATMSRYPHELSGGQRQRVAIARALAAEPSVLVCDEITSALDVSVQAGIVSLLDELRRDLGLAVLFATHNIALLRSTADRIVVMNHGRICEQGPTSQVLNDPRHVYTRKLMLAVREGDLR